MSIEEYRASLHEDIAIKASTNYTNPSDEFILYATTMLSEAEEFDDFIECYYEGVSRRKANMRIDGYSINPLDGSCCVFITDYRGPHEDDAIHSTEINALFRRIRFFVNEAIQYDLYSELEESTEVYEFARTLYYEKDSITKFRFFLLTDAFNRQRSKNIKDEVIAGKQVELNVWDISRLFDLANSTTQKESVEIVLSDLNCEGIPCVKAVEYHNVIADIDTTFINQEMDKDDTQARPANVISYSSYLAVVPGQVLNDLYLEYGSRLLEGNVRSFLSTKVKVNKGIQNTVKNYPEMFFAYNNGIAATATALDTTMTEDGLKITKIKDLQIVNGGQTTASIANTLLTLRKGETADISKLYVPMKISVLDHEMAEKIIPKISEYSNSQNPVDASDFFSNHPFHIRMEEYSRKIPAPAVNGNQFQQYWFYERARGQYNQGKMKFKKQSSQLKQYETKYPENQVIKLVDLAKYMKIFDGSPHVVSKGRQAIVKVFAEDIKKQWNTSDTEFNPYYFKRIVALAIMFKELDGIIKQTTWYKEKHSYKANVIAYTMSVLFDDIRKNHRGYSLDFMRIWNSQCLYEELICQLQTLCTEVYEFITRDDRGTENVTQWCKAEACWTRAQKENWTILPKFIRTLIPSDEIKEEIKEAKEIRKINNEVDLIKSVLAVGSSYWKSVRDWGSSRFLLSDAELGSINAVINTEVTGKTPSVRQASVAVRARQKLIQEGMPMQFKERETRSHRS